jgi:hypothetical protein
MPYQALEGAEFIHQFIFNLGTRLGWLIDATIRLHYPRETDLALFAEKA